MSEHPKNWNKHKKHIFILKTKQFLNMQFHKKPSFIFFLEIAYKFVWRKSRVLINLIFTGDTLMMNKLATNEFDFQYDIFLINYPPTNFVLRLLKVKFKFGSRGSLNSLWYLYYFLEQISHIIRWVRNLWFFKYWRGPMGVLPG